MKKIVSLLIIILLGIISTGCGISLSSNPSSNDTGMYPPMINIDGIVYLITEDFYTVDEEKLQKIGVVDKCLKSGRVKPTHPSGTSNYYPVGSEIFMIDGQEGFIVKVEGSYVLLARTE